MTEKSTCEPVPSRHEHHQRCYETSTVRNAGGWMSEQRDEDLFISTLTVAEIRRGILEKPLGKKRGELERWFVGPHGPQALFAGRVLPFDEKASLIWARLMAEGTNTGRPRSPLDMIVAAVAESNDCVVVTANEKHFGGLTVVNPLRPKG